MTDLEPNKDEATVPVSEQPDPLVWVEMKMERIGDMKCPKCLEVMSLIIIPTGGSLAFCVECKLYYERKALCRKCSKHYVGFKKCPMCAETVMYGCINAKCKQFTTEFEGFAEPKGMGVVITCPRCGGRAMRTGGEPEEKPQ